MNKVRPATRQVVLLHGLARRGRSFARLARHLRRAGYSTWSPSYPSTRLSLPELADWVAAAVTRRLGDTPIFGITHSLGGIVARQLAGRLDWRGLVMVAPPNQGSRVARALRRMRLFEITHGPAGPSLASPAGWPPPPRPFAVIAGTRGLTMTNPTSWLSRATRILPAEVPSDGTLAVEETKLDGMSDFATVDACHTWILDHPQTATLTLRFLAQGTFAL